MSTKDIWDELGEAWGCPVVAREQIGVFTGGLVHPNTMRNCDSRGEGPGKICLSSRKIGYKTTNLVSWLRQRAEAANFQG